MFQAAKLGELCTLRAGSAFKTHLQGNKSGRYPFIKVSDMNLPSNEVCIREANHWIEESVRAEIKAKPLPPGTTVFAKIGEALKHNRVRLLIMDTIVDNNMMGAIPNRDVVDPKFFYYLLSNFDIAGTATGTALPYLTVSTLVESTFQVPPLPLQRRIAGILSAYDELIENNQRRIKILESMARAIYREWFVHFRFPGHESVPLVPSPLGEIPWGWEVKSVEEIVKRIPVGKKYDQKTVASTGSVPVFDQGKSGIIGYHDDEPGVVASETAPVIVFANHTCYQRLIHIPFSAIQNVLPFVPSPVQSRDIYWLHWATNGLVVFNDYKGHWPEFAATTLIVPNVELCQRFGEFAAPLSLQMLGLERQIQNLRRTRDLLLPRLISGQVDLEVVPA